MVYHMCGCPKNLRIPINDFEAIRLYENYKHLYNKKFIAESQNIECGREEIPKKFPVIVRPVINLHGMGKGAYYVKSIYNFPQISKNNFWTEVLKGPHISVDIFKNSFGIMGTVAFLGKPGPLFTFDYWEYLPNFKLPKKIESWMYRYLEGFKGVFNLEMIGDKIIECHLRMGDLNYFQSEDLTNKVIQCHQDKNVTLPRLPKIFLVPVFVKKGAYKRLKKEEIFYCARPHGIDKVLNYSIDIDPKKIGNPPGGDRICILTVADLNTGMKIRNCILNYLKKNRA